MRKTTRLRLIFFPSVFLVALLAGGCSSSDTRTDATPQRETSGTPAALGGTDWSLITMNGEPVTPAGVITLSFDNNNGIAGRAAVNRYMVNSVRSGSGSALTLGEVGSTRMAGPEAMMMLEKRYLAMLPAVNHWHAADGKLTLGTAENPSALVFKSVDDK